MWEYRISWRQLNHSVCLIGYGVTKDGVKYWEVANSFGVKYGDRGYFRIRRGMDDFGVESYANAIDIELI